MVLIHKIGFIITEDKRSNTREEDRSSIHCMNMETCRWVASVRAGHAGVKDST